MINYKRLLNNKSMLNKKINNKKINIILTSHYLTSKIKIIVTHLFYFMFN